MAKKRGLGMGLGALIQGSDSINVTESASSRTIPSSVNDKKSLSKTKSSGTIKSAKPANSTKTSAKPPTANLFFGSPNNKSPNLRPHKGEQKAGEMLGKGEVLEDLVPTPGATFAMLPIKSVEANKSQPRSAFDEDELRELSASIKEFGILQPIRVREILSSGLSTGKYELIAGERRLRASKLAKLTEIPAIIADVKDDNMLAEALIENLQRVNLNALEVAASYRQLMDDFNLTQEKLATKIGKGRSAIANTLRLLKLPVTIQRRIASGVLSEGHARALISVTDDKIQDKLAARIVQEGLSVRAVEEEVALLSSDSIKSNAGRGLSKTKKLKSDIPSFALKISEELSDYLDTVVDVKVASNKNKGQLLINFADFEDLKRIQLAIEE